MDAVASLLGDRFGRLPHVHNLFLCIGSRTAEWRTSLEEALRQKWGQESVGVYELAPLTPGQVLSAAKLHLRMPSVLSPKSLPAMSPHLQLSRSLWIC